MNKAAFVLACVFLLGAAAASVALAEERPQAPFISPLPGFAHYEMVEETVAKDKGARVQAAQPHLTRLEFKKSGETIQLIGTFSDAKTLEAWMYNDLALLQQLNPPTVLINTLENTASSDLPLGKEDFKLLSWLSAEAFKKKTEYAGKECWLFENPGSTENGELRAWIDVKTKLPEAFQNGNITYRFHYLEPPSGPLELSPVFANAWAEYQGAMKVVTVSAPQPPYIAKLPKFARYEIAEIPKPSPSPSPTQEKPAPAPVRLTRAVVTKTGETKQIVGLFSNGKTLEAWMYQSLVMLQQLAPPSILINSLENTGSDLPIGDGDFQNLDWLGAQTYKQIVPYEGLQCYLFQMTLGSGTGAEISRALIDVKTKLPVAVESHGKAYRYKYHEPPTQPLQLSPAFAKAWKDYQNSLKSVTARSGPR